MNNIQSKVGAEESWIFSKHFFFKYIVELWNFNCDVHERKAGSLLKNSYDLNTASN